MAIEKPLPMQIGDKYYFTLTSYDPVSITVRVPTVIDADVDNALEDLAMGVHLELSELDDAKVAELYQGRVNTLAELRERLRRELGDYNAANAEQSKGRLCGEVLAERLCQQVPPRMIAEHAHYLSLQNPAPEGVAYAALKRFQGQNGAGRKAREYLISKGYDSVNNEGEEYIAFYPSQIKSATDNVGTYDPNNPDVRFSMKNARDVVSAIDNDDQHTVFGIRVDRGRLRSGETLDNSRAWYDDAFRL